MPLKSDLSIDASLFDPSRVSEQTKKFNDGLIKMSNAGPKWFETLYAGPNGRGTTQPSLILGPAKPRLIVDQVGAAKYRQMRWNGETPMPKPAVLEHGQNITVPSREPGRNIPCRVFRPVDGGRVHGVFYHIHGGGWVLQSEAFQDLMLAHYADHSGLAVVSVGYRLAPEHPFPAGNEDCFDVAEYLVDHAARDYGAPLKFLGGDSAGGHLSVVTTYHLLRARPAFAFHGLVLNYGAYDISGHLPQTWNFKVPLILDRDIMDKYIEAYLPNTTAVDRRDMWISPFFADLTKMKLPPALFVCGTADPLLDDSVMMSAKWAMSGAESVLKIYPGAPHGFTFFPKGGTELTETALNDIATFMNERR